MPDTEKRFQNYFNLGLIGMAITSLEKGWVDVNEKLCEILGYSREELVELSWAEVTHPDDLEADLTEFQRVITGEIEGYTMDKRFIRKDGIVIYASISVNCIRRDDGAIDHFVAFVQDITDRKTAEIKLNKMNTELESLVKNRTRELEKANKQLKINCETDYLTKLSNRRFYERRLRENISTAQRNDTYLALLMIDIDNFKTYNDIYGHDNGDIILCRVAESIVGSLQRATDLVSRFGGEEFVVLLPDTDAESAFAIAERIRKHIELLGIKYPDCDAGIVTVSIGIETLKADKLNKTDLFKHADIALYSAKDNGRNCSDIYKKQI
jgi:diguanylate cyclase (GGDEF)-like protein/PAS domain S-box-containing protein